MIDIIEFNKTHNTPSELMLAVKELTDNQVRMLALDLVWKLAEKGHNNLLLVKRAIFEAKLKP
jgi:hypothetical protein